MIGGGCPLTDNVEFASFDRVDELDVDDCCIEGADRLGGCLGLREDTFIVEAGLEGPGVLAGGRVSAEMPFTAGWVGKLWFLV